MKYSKSDLCEIMTSDGGIGNLIELLRVFKQYKTQYHGGGMITLEGYTTFDKDVYLVYMNTKLVDDKPVYCLTIDSVTVTMEYKTYIFLVNYIIKCSEVKNLVEFQEQDTKKSFWQRLFGE